MGSATKVQNSQEVNDLNAPGREPSLFTSENKRWAFKVWTNWVLIFTLADLLTRIVPSLRNTPIPPVLYGACAITLLLWRLKFGRSLFTETKKRDEIPNARLP
jgi:hypothetical protein